MQVLQKHGPDHRNPQGGRGYEGGSDVSRKDTDVQACIKPEVLLVFYAHCEPHCRNSVLADSVKCIPEVYWFFTPLQKRCVLCVPKVVWDTYRYFKGPPRESQRLRHKDTVARQLQWLQDSEREADNHHMSPGRNIWREKQWQSCGGKRSISQNRSKVCWQHCNIDIFWWNKTSARYFTVPITPPGHG